MRSRRLTEPPRPCEGEDFASAEARRWTEPVWQLSNLPRHPFGRSLIGLRRSQRWQVAAALSAAVTTTKPQGNRVHLAWALNSKGRDKSIPSRSSGERGLGGEGLLSEKPPLPQNLPPLVFSGGNAREGPFLQKRSLPRKTINSLLLLSKRLHSRDAPREDRCRCGPCDRRRPSDDRSGGADQSAQ